MAKHIPYEENHRINNNILEKKCNKHNIYFPDEDGWMPCTLEYFHKNLGSKKDGLNTWCKRCASEKGKESYHNGDPEHNKQLRASNYKNNKEVWKIRKRKNVAKNPKLYKGIVKKFQQENPGRVKIYNEKHRIHDITKAEKRALLKVFGHKCAYCGMTEEENKIKDSERLHHDHVDHEGYNDLRNDVPACTSCNCSKWKQPMEEWYRQQEFFSEERLQFIYWWTTEGYKKHIEDKPPYRILRKRNDDNRTYHHELWTVDEKRNVIECIKVVDKKKDLEIYIKKFFETA